MSLAGYLLRPQSVALVGASNDAGKTTGRPLQYLQRSGFQGRIFPINPHRSTVLGLPAYPSIEALPETPQHAFVMVPTGEVAAAVAACIKRKVPLVTVLASGYGEAGEAGRARETELRAALRGTSTRLLGPNSIGVVGVHSGLSLTVNAAFAATEKLQRGGVFVASHSGSMLGALLSRGQSRGLGYAGFVSTGSEIDLSLGEICSMTLDDENIDVYALFLESIRHGEALRRFAIAAAERGKAVVAYKLGRSAQAAELSQSHTGAIAGEDGIADALLKDCGIARVETLDGLIEAPLLLRRVGLGTMRRKVRVAVVSTTGGGAAMVVDQLGMRGVDVVVSSDATMAALAGSKVQAARARVIDLTLAGTRPEIMNAALKVLLAAPESDIVVAVAGSSVLFHPELLLPPIIECAQAVSKPLVAFLAPDAPEALANLARAGVPSFRSPESCADVIAATFARRHPKAVAEAVAGGESTLLDEAAGYTQLSTLQISAAPYRVVPLNAGSSPLPYPVAVKMVSSQTLHKTDAGGVVLGVGDDDGFRSAVQRISANVAAALPDIALTHVLVQSMVKGMGEVLLSYRCDADAGPLVMLAAGGILAELHKDRALRLAPVNLEEAWDMIGEVKALRALSGYRGRPRGDLDALAESIVRISHAGPQFEEIEINPLLVGAAGEGVVAVDSVVRRWDKAND